MQGTTFAQPAAVKKIIETGQTDNRVMHQLDILTNRFGEELWLGCIRECSRVDDA